jgi:hypothetical protein
VVIGFGCKSHRKSFRSWSKDLCGPELDIFWLTCCVLMKEGPLITWLGMRRTSNWITELIKAQHICDNPLQKARLFRKQQSKVDSKGFWRWCTSFRNNAFLAFVHYPKFWTNRKHNVSEIWSVSIFRNGRETPIPLGLLEKTNLNHCLAFLRDSTQ